MYTTIVPGKFSTGNPGDTSGGAVGGAVGVVALTRTRKLPVARLPAGSLALQYTVVVPMGKVAPEGGEQLILSWLDG